MLSKDITCVIPVWGEYVRFLPEALQSVRRQSLPAEVIVVDNASDYALPPLGNVRTLRLAARVSTGEARNAGLESVRTPFVLFLDADDALLDGALEHLREVLRRRPEAVAAVGRMLDARSGSFHVNPRPFVGTLARHRHILAALHAAWPVIPTQGCTLMRTQTARAGGGYHHVSVGEEWALGFALSTRGAVVFSSRPVLSYRPSSTSISVRSVNRSLARARGHITSDPSVPRAANLALPLLAVAHWSALYLARPIVRGLRSLRAARLQPPPEGRNEVERHPHDPPRIGQR